MVLHEQVSELVKPLYEQADATDSFPEWLSITDLEADVAGLVSPEQNIAEHGIAGEAFGGPHALKELTDRRQNMGSFDPLCSLRRCVSYGFCKRF